MKPAVTFAELRQLLLELDFQETVVPRSHIGFHHDRTGAEVYLPVYRPGQVVAPRHLLMVRVMVDAKGLMEADKFDRFVASSTLKGTAS
jgi:hypothetical protein